MELDDYTPRQRQVITEMCKGKSNKEIACTLEVEEATIKLHMSAIFRTMGVSNRYRAIIKASDFHIIEKESITLTDLDILKEFVEVTFKTTSSQWSERVLEFGHAIQNKTKEQV